MASGKDGPSALLCLLPARLVSAALRLYPGSFRSSEEFLGQLDDSLQDSWLTAYLASGMG